MSNSNLACSSEYFSRLLQGPNLVDYQLWWIELRHIRVRHLQGLGKEPH